MASRDVPLHKSAHGMALFPALWHTGLWRLMPFLLIYSIGACEWSSLCRRALA